MPPSKPRPPAGKARQGGRSGTLRSWLIITVAAVLSTCSTPPTLLEEVRAVGELRVVTRNSPTSYYIGPAGPVGPEFELVQGFADYLGVRLELMEAERFADLLADVEQGHAHLAAAGLTATEGRSQRVRFGPAYQEVSQHVVYRRGRRSPRSTADLVGRRVEVVAQSSYVEALNRQREALPALTWTEDPSADAGELLERVAQGTSDLTIVDSNIFSIFQRFHPELRVAFDVTTGDPLAWAFPQHRDDSLIVEAEAYLDGLRQSGELAHILDRYYGHKLFFDYAGTRKFMQDYRSLLPSLRTKFEAAGRRADLDWRLLAAIGYQESHWDPTAESHKGAQGMMMLTPETATFMSIADPLDASQSIMGGAKYLWRLRRRIERIAPEMPEHDLNWMMLAAYNMGYGHLLDVRRLTVMNGGNPDRWADVRKSLPLLMERRWYTQLRYGYARGRETMAYVRNVRNYYDILVWLTEEQQPTGSRRSLTAANTPAPGAPVSP